MKIFLNLNFSILEELNLKIMFKSYTQYYDNKSITSKQTIINYEGCLKNYFNLLSFSDANQDIQKLKDLNKSYDTILLCLKSTIFYIDYHLGWKSNIIPIIQDYIINNTVFLKNPNKIDVNKNPEDYYVIIQVYRNYIKKINTITRAKKCLKKNKNDNGEYPKWKMLINIDYDNLTEINKHIYKIYTLMPCRRLEEYIKMVFTFNSENIKIIKNIEDRNEKLNYCFINMNNIDNSYFVFQIYKNDKFFNKPVKIKLWKKMKKYLLDYVKNNNIQEGDKFINLTSIQTLGNHLKRIFNCSVDILRHSYIQYVHNKYENGIISYIDLHNISKIMGHTLQEQLNYKNMKV